MARYFWHNIGTFDTLEDREKRWNKLMEENLITVGHDDKDESKGRDLISSYQKGDVIIAYVSEGVGAVGFGIVEQPEYRHEDGGHLPDFYRGYHKHGMRVSWKGGVKQFRNAVNPRELRDEYGLHVPRGTIQLIKKSAAAEDLTKYFLDMFPIRQQQ